MNTISALSCTSQYVVYLDNIVISEQSIMLQHHNKEGCVGGNVQKTERIVHDHKIG